MGDPFDAVKGINMSVGVLRRTEKQSYSKTVKLFGGWCVQLGDNIVRGLTMSLWIVSRSSDKFKNGL
jgi:hypothetical protein